MHSCTPERLFNVENVKPQMPLRFERASDEEPEIRCDCGTRLKLGRLPWQSRCLRCKQPWKARHLWRYHTEVLGLVGRLPWNCHLKYKLRIIAEPELSELPPKVPVSWSQEKLPAAPKGRPPLRMTRSDPSAEEPAPEEGPACEEVSEEPSSAAKGPTVDVTGSPQFELESEEDVEVEPEEEEELGADLCEDPECDCKIAGVSGVTEFDLEWDFSDWIQLSPLRDPECPDPPMSQEALDLEKDSRPSEPSVEDSQMGLDVEEELKRPLKRLKHL